MKCVFGISETDLLAFYHIPMSQLKALVPGLMLCPFLP